MYDFAIVGSGVSGGRIAYELVSAGARCILIEAGREYSAETFPDNELDSSGRLFWGGGLELSSDGRVGFLRAKCLGGTSIVNQALLDRFDDLAWDDWRARSGISFFNSAEMSQQYDAIEGELSISEIPRKFYNRNAEIFTRSCGELGFGWKPLHRAQGDCALEKGSDCIVCLGGCPRDSKQSALVTVIRQARERGLEIESEFEVSALVHAADEVRVQGTQRGQKRELRAARLVLAAGSLGNTGILLRSGLGAKLPALGTAFTCHPQYMTYAFFPEPVDAHKGAFQAVKSDDRRMREGGYKLENVFAPPIGTAMLLPGFGRKHHRLMRQYRYYASAEVAIRDDAAGKITLGGDGRLKISKPITRADRKRAREGLDIVYEIFAKSGSKEIVVCKQTFGLHLMGGCPIGTDGARSVVDPDFRVQGCPRVFAADSSIFPSAPGINPSFSIMALSRRASQCIAREAR